MAILLPLERLHQAGDRDRELATNLDLVIRDSFFDVASVLASGEPLAWHARAALDDTVARLREAVEDQRRLIARLLDERGLS